MAGQANTSSPLVPSICASLKQIVATTTAMERFWRQAHGWAPSSAACMLTAARLDRQVSFAHTLPSYLEPFPKEEAEARLILGYVTLRSLCEGVLKLFFAVWLEDYQSDADAVIDKKGTIKSPADIGFDRLITLYSKKVESKYEPYLRRIQQRGNGIHHFRDKDVGTQDEFLEDIVQFRNFLLDVNIGLPYPDEHYDPGMA